MKVTLLRPYSQDIQQPPDYQKVVFGGYRDYILEIEGWPDETSVRHITIASRIRGGGFGLERRAIEQQEGRDVIRVYLSANLLGHDVDQWATYDLETGERIDLKPSS
jgi:hypothetical protein